MKYQYTHGDFLMFTYGEYSDYRIDEHARAIASFDIREEFFKWANSEKLEVKLNTYETRGKRINFIMWLFDQNLIEFFTVNEVYLGDYGDVRIDVDEDSTNENTP